MLRPPAAFISREDTTRVNLLFELTEEGFAGRCC
jgi:hypothetical protein